MLFNHLILCHLLLLLPSIFSSIRVFSNESVIHIRWPKYWKSFSISPFNGYSELISFSIDWFDLLAVQGTLKISPVPQFKSINSLVLSLLYSPSLTSIHDYWKKPVPGTWFMPRKVDLKQCGLSPVSLWSSVLCSSVLPGPRFLNRFPCWAAWLPWSR